MTRTITCLSLIAAGILVAAPASARPPVIVNAPSDVTVRTVSFADLDLATGKGQRQLTRRIYDAAYAVCANYDGAAGNHVWALGYSPCFVGALDEAQAPMAAAVKRARQLAASGSSSIVAAAALTVSAPR